MAQARARVLAGGGRLPLLRRRARAEPRRPRTDAPVAPQPEGRAARQRRRPRPLRRGALLRCGAARVARHLRGRRRHDRGRHRRAPRRREGLPQIARAFLGLPERDRYRLVIAGGADPDKPDALDPSLVARAEAEGVRFLGQRGDVDALYAAMDVFVLASHREGFPRAAMEAAATSRPVIATDVRGCRQVVDDGRNGLLVPVRDPAALRAAIGALGTDPGRRARMGAASREVARERFDERRVVEIVLATYARVARRKGLEIPGLAGLPDITRP
ncbi:MAG: glycosyltransferase [Acidimicrobiia bacterium]